MWRSHDKRAAADGIGAKTESVLRPERVVRRPLPPNLRDREADLFADERHRVLLPSMLRQLADVRISADGLLFSGPRILSQSFPFPALQAQLSTASRLKLIGVNFAFKRRRNLGRKGLWIIDTWSAGYFHWMIDALSRLYMVRDELSEASLVLPTKIAALEYVRASLAAFDANDIELIGDDEFVLCRALLLPDHAAPPGQLDEAVIRGVRKTLLRRHGAPPSASTGARVYISRSLAHKRRVANEDAVIEVLRAHRFQVVHTEKMPLGDQIGLFSTASFLIGNHGAGLTNMLFLPRHGKVLELRHQADAVNNCYFTLAAALGLEYFFQGCPPVHPADDPHVADVVVDIKRLAETLR